MNYVKRSALAAVAVVGTACGAHRVAPDDDPLVLTKVQAELRIVGAETTWVAHGFGYELVARTKGDIAMLQPELDRISGLLTRVFPIDTLAHVGATVRRVSSPSATSSKGAAPIPGESPGPVVELMLPDAKLRQEEKKRAHSFGGAAAEGEIVRPVLRAWIAAHASKLTDKPARFAELTGEADDVRVPAWAYEMILLLGNTATVENMTRALAAHPESVIPLANYFTMPRPAPPERMAEVRPSRGPSRNPGQEGPGRGRGGGTGGRGGSGPPGGMTPPGGTSPGGGRGFPGGGGKEGGTPRDDPRVASPLEDAALFAAQSAVLGKFLSREGFDLVGELMDSQIVGKPLETVLAARGLGDLAKLDRDWRYWLGASASALDHR